MVKKLNAELWDKMHYLFRDFNDRMVHVELHYDFEIDIDALKKLLFCIPRLLIINSKPIGK